MSTEIAFSPASRQVSRHDGWTDELQMEFIAVLEESGNVSHAARSVGKSRASAYRLKDSPEGADFSAAWEKALGYALKGLRDAAIDRAMNGVRQCVFYKGQPVGSRIWFDNRLLMFLLRAHDPRRYGKRTEERELLDEIVAHKMKLEVRETVARDLFKGMEADMDAWSDEQEALGNEDWEDDPEYKLMEEERDGFEARADAAREMIDELNTTHLALPVPRRARRW